MLVFLYMAAAVFVAGNIFRVARIAAMPVHLRWELFPIPAGQSAKLKVMADEILLLSGVRENNRPLWIWSWLLHWGLYLMICGIAVTVTDVLLRHSVSGSVPPLAGVISVLCWVSVVAGVCGTAGLIILRTVSPLLRTFTSRGSLCNLAILFVLFATGLGMIAIEDRALPDMGDVAGALMGLGTAPSLSFPETLHLCVLGLFLAYFPFTHMTHMYLKYFTFHSIRWDDLPCDASPALQRKMNRVMNLPAGWPAAHIRGDGNKTWRSIAAEAGADATEKTRN